MDFDAISLKCFGSYVIFARFEILRVGLWNRSVGQPLAPWLRPG